MSTSSAAPAPASSSDNTKMANGSLLSRKKSAVFQNTINCLSRSISIGRQQMYYFMLLLVCAMVVANERVHADATTANSGTSGGGNASSRGFNAPLARSSMVGEEMPMAMAMGMPMMAKASGESMHYDADMGDVPVDQMMNMDAGSSSEGFAAAAGTGSSSHYEMLGSIVLQALQKDSSSDGSTATDDTTTTTTTTPKRQMLVHSGNIELAFAAGNIDIHNHHGDANKGYFLNLDAMADQVDALAHAAGKGYTESRSKSKGGRWDHLARNEVYSWSIDISMRVASDQFHTVMKKLQEIASAYKGCSVENSSTHSRDVTDQYIDITARADTLSASRRAMEGILSKANHVRDVVEIQRELNSLIQQEESQRKRAVYLKKDSDFSTIRVTLTQPIEQKGDDDDDKKKDVHSWDPSKTFGLALKHVVVVIRFIADTISYATVWIVPLAIIKFIMYLARPSNRQAF